MHKIAIVKIIESTHYDEYDDPIIETMASSITEWEEVDDDRYKLLKSAVKASAANNYVRDYIVIEQLKTSSVEIVNSVDQYIKMIAEKQRKSEEVKEKRDKARKATQAKKELEAKKTRKALLLQLKEEFPDIA